MSERKFSFGDMPSRGVRESKNRIDAEITENVWRWYMQGYDPYFHKFGDRDPIVPLRALSRTVTFIRTRELIEDKHLGKSSRVHVGLWFLEQGIISPETVAADIERESPAIWENLLGLDAAEVNLLNKMLENRTDEISAITRGEDFPLTDDHAGNSSRRSEPHDQNHRLAQSIQVKLFPGTSQFIRGAIFALFVGLATRKIEYVQLDENKTRLQLVQDNSQGIRRDS